MAYGSPERLDDVPAYYADIRGGRPISPEHLEDLVARYRRLGIEDSNPLNAITEADARRARGRARVARLHGDEALDSRGSPRPSTGRRGGADKIVGLVLAPHYSSALDRRLPRAARRRRRRPRRVLFVDAGTTTPASSRARRPRPRHRRPRRLHGALAAGADPRRGRSVPGRAARDRGSSPRRQASTEWSFSFQSESPTGEPWLGPDILDHLTELRAAASTRCSSARSGSCPITGDPLGPRRRGAGARGESSGSSSTGSRCRTPTRSSSACSPGSFGARRGAV